jgi:hypothetical protein
LAPFLTGEQRELNQKQQKIKKVEIEATEPRPAPRIQPRASAVKKSSPEKVPEKSANLVPEIEEDEAVEEKPLVRVKRELNERSSYEKSKKRQVPEKFVEKVPEKFVEKVPEKIVEKVPEKPKKREVPVEVKSETEEDSSEESADDDSSVDENDVAEVQPGVDVIKLFTAVSYDFS